MRIDREVVKVEGEDPDTHPGFFKPLKTKYNFPRGKYIREKGEKEICHLPAYHTLQKATRLTHIVDGAKRYI